MLVCMSHKCLKKQLLAFKHMNNCDSGLRDDTVNYLHAFNTACFYLQICNVYIWVKCTGLFMCVCFGHHCSQEHCLSVFRYVLIVGVDRYGFLRADADTDYYRSSRPITDILNRYTCLV